MVKLRNFLLRKVYNIFKDHCYEMFRLQSVQGKIGYEMFIQNRQVTKFFGYKMFKLQITKFIDTEICIFLFQKSHYFVSQIIKPLQHSTAAKPSNLAKVDHILIMSIHFLK